MAIEYRRARESELPRVLELLIAGDLDPRDLIPSDILVALDREEIVGVNRIRRYHDGALEIASAYVIPSHREQGINRKLTELLRDECRGPVYIITAPKNEEYVGKMGFVPVADRTSVPASIAEKINWCAAKYTTHTPGVFVFGG